MRALGAMRSRDESRIECARRDLRAALDMARCGPFMEAFIGRDDESFMLVRHSVEMLEHALEDAPRNRSKLPTSKKPPSEKK